MCSPNHSRSNHISIVLWINQNLATTKPSDFLAKRQLHNPLANDRDWWGLTVVLFVFLILRMFMQAKKARKQYLLGIAYSRAIVGLHPSKTRLFGNQNELVFANVNHE